MALCVRGAGIRPGAPVGAREGRTMQVGGERRRGRGQGASGRRPVAGRLLVAEEVPVVVGLCAH
jgi:hypothetical protein